MSSLFLQQNPVSTITLVQSAVAVAVDADVVSGDDASPNISDMQLTGAALQHQGLGFRLLGLRIHLFAGAAAGVAETP